MEITWSIDNMDRRTDDDFVYCVHWRATAQDGDYSASVYGTLHLPEHKIVPGQIPTGFIRPIIPFKDLTPQMVLGWVFIEMGEAEKAEIEANLANQIEALKNPVQKSGVPW